MVVQPVRKKHDCLCLPWVWLRVSCMICHLVPSSKNCCYQSQKTKSSCRCSYVNESIGRVPRGIDPEEAQDCLTSYEK
jgi:hypothetical protein